jgi:hypothetical protein
VALLCYQPDDPQRSVFYPFADFSPEWQAILYARKQNIHVRFMDLPAGNQMLVEKERRIVNIKKTNRLIPIKSNLEAQSYEQLHKNPDQLFIGCCRFCRRRKMVGAYF